MRIRFAVALLAATAVAPFAAQAQYYHDPGYTQEDAAGGAAVGGSSRPTTTSSCTAIDGTRSRST